MHIISISLCDCIFMYIVVKWEMHKEFCWKILWKEAACKTKAKMGRLLLRKINLIVITFLDVNNIEMA